MGGLNVHNSAIVESNMSNRVIPGQGSLPVIAKSSNFDERIFDPPLFD
jgi:hypothetical protein